MNHELLSAAKKVAGRKAGECKHCGGNGKYFVDSVGKKVLASVMLEHDKAIFVECSCSLCARIREIAEWKQSNTCALIFECDCGATESNPCSEYIPVDLTVQSVRALLEDLGEWTQFICWLVLNKFILDDNGRPKYPEHVMLRADILTSDTLITEATTEYLKSIMEGLS